MASKDSALSYADARRQSSAVAAIGLSSEDDAAVLGDMTSQKTLAEHARLTKICASKTWIQARIAA